MPRAIEPMALKLIHKPFDNEQWQFEIKWDGFRIVSYLNKGQVFLRSRKQHCFNERFFPITNELQLLPFNAVLDGEVVILDEEGCSDFNRLISGEQNCLVYFVFDLLWYNGLNLMQLPLFRRREILRDILPDSKIIRFSDHMDEKGTELFSLIEGIKAEGIVAKKKNSIYLPAERTNSWLKIKKEKVVEGVVAGLLLDNDKHGSGFSSLIIGIEDGKKYRYIGLVETGIQKNDLKEILFSGKPQKTSIFSPVPHVNANQPFRKRIKNAEIIWLDPSLKCRVEYLESDEYGLMRHSSFLGLI